MSGYRTLHRIHDQSNKDDPTHIHAAPSPIWRIRFSPCRYFHSSPGVPANASPSAFLAASSGHRLICAGASNVLRAYSLVENTSKDVNTDDVLNASAMSVRCTELLASKDYFEGDHGSVGSRSSALLGYAALDVARNYAGSDESAGNEIVVASQLGGRVSVWARLDPVLALKTGDGGDGGKLVRPRSEFTVPHVTGTTIAIRPPALGSYYSKKEKDVLVALGCANGAVAFCRTGILAARPGENAGGGSSGTVGDSSSNSNEEVVILSSNSPPGQVMATVGEGHACVLSLAFHPTAPNTFVVGRKDGTIDIYSSYESNDSYRNEEDLAYRRIHRLVHSSVPIRALSYSQPDGALLFAGDDDGNLFSYDVSVPLSSSSSTASTPSTVKLVACALHAHKGWIMNLTTLPDGRRLATCGSDGSVRVWDSGMGLASNTPAHSFEGVHAGYAWGVDCGCVVGGSESGIGRMNNGSRPILASCGNDGVIQIFSCGE